MAKMSIKKKEEGLGNESVSTDAGGPQVKQRSMPLRCPNLCNNFECMLAGHCNMECEKLDIAKALICDLCVNDCSETQKKILLDTKYFQEKKKEFSRNILDGVKEIKDRHYYLETRYKELKQKAILTSWWHILRLLEIKSEGSKIRYELELLRNFMDTLEIPYKKEVDLDG